MYDNYERRYERQDDREARALPEPPRDAQTATPRGAMMQRQRWNAVNAAMIFGTLGWVLIGLLAYGLVGAIETGGLW